MGPQAYHVFLTDDPIIELDNLPTQLIDHAVNTIHNRIQQATEATCERSTTRIYQQNKPAQKIRDKMNEYQRACHSHNQTCQPPVLALQALRRETVDLMLTHSNYIWGTLVSQANQFIMEPGNFWRKFKQLLDLASPSLTHLVHTHS